MLALRHGAAGRGAAPADRRADHLGDHGRRSASSTVFQAALKWIFGIILQPFPPIFATERVNLLGPADADRLPDEPRGLARHHGRHGVVLPASPATAWRCAPPPSTSRWRSRSASRCQACSPWPGRSRRSSRRSPASSSAWSTACPSGLSVYGIKVFPAVILGGLDSIVGAVLGGIIIGLLENLAHYLDSQFLHWGNLYEIAPFYVLIVILMIRPYGLFGTKTSSGSRNRHDHAKPRSGRRFPHQLCGATRSSSRRDQPQLRGRLGVVAARASRRWCSATTRSAC